MLSLTRCIIAVLLATGHHAAHGEPLPPKVMKAMQQGYHSYDRKVLTSAARVMEAHLKTDPENRELIGALGILYLDRFRDAKHAMPHLEKMVEGAPEEGAWQQALARALRATGQHASAVEHFRMAADLDPRDVWSRYELGNTLAVSGEYKEAAAAYRSALDIKARNTDARLALARVLWADGQITESKLAARGVLEFEPANREARKLLAAAPPVPNVASAPAVAGAPALAAAPAKAPAPAPKPVSPLDAAVADAYLSGRPEKFERAAAMLESSLLREPGHLKNRQSLAYLYLEKLHAPARAVPHLEKVSAALPRDTNWLQMLAKAQAQSGDRAAAALTYRRAAIIAPRDAWARYHLGCVLRELGKKGEAEAAFREALALEPRSSQVRRELARSLQDAGKSRDASALTEQLIREDPRDAEAHVILGDIYRAQRDFADADAAYHAALANSPAHPLALAGIRDIRNQKRPAGKFAFYTFDDTDHLRQSGIFSYVSVLLTGRLEASAFLNERFFKRSPGETVERFEAGAGLSYRFNHVVQLALGISQFKTSNLDRETGANVALYVTPLKALDFSLSYRHADPINDSYITASRAFTQNTFSGSINVRPTRTLAASLSASTSEYSDGNTRRSALASVAWHVPLPASPIVKLEYEWLDFSRGTSDYASPQDYTRLRPVLEIAPRITDWLTIEIHGELSYVFDERAWGKGLTVGPRLKFGDNLNFGLSYMNYQIPGGQTIWSGEGFKVELSSRF